MSYLFSHTGKDEHAKLRFTICVSGAAAGETVIQDADIAEQLGAAIANRGHLVTTGATIGLPMHAARGAKEAGGISIGFSPAASLREHLRKYRLPYKYFDFINFTGMEYVGRDLYLVQSSDALITVGGRFGSLHEFTSALEAGKPCGVLLGTGGTADLIPQLMEVLEPPARSRIVYDTDPEKLVGQVEDILKKEYADIQKQYAKNDQFWFVDKTNRRG
jgi:uncharacterized protein (TIGR00725 family)